MRPIRIGFLLLTLVAAGCSSSTALTTSTSTTTTTARVSTTTTLPVDPLTLLIEELTTVIETVRQLDFRSPPDLVFVTDAELAVRVRALIEDELDPVETRRDALLLAALGLIDPGTDLATLYTDLYSEQVVGFYDGESGELVVPIGDGELSQLQRLTLVHELTHALTDQHFRFAGEMIELEDGQLFERLTALSAVAEGDAKLTEALYMKTLARDAQLEILQSSLEVDSDVFYSTPRFLQELLLFPYTAGFDFVTDVWESGGFEAVNALYVDSPTTTEQIFHPADFMAGEQPVDVEPGEFVPDGYDVVETSVWGQAAFRAMFGQALDDAVATAAAVGWGGDTYRLMWNGESDIVFDLVFSGDSSIDNEEMFEALDSFVRRQIDGEITGLDDGYVEVSGEDFAVVDVSDGLIRFILATDPAVGRLVVDSVAP